MIRKSYLAFLVATVVWLVAGHLLYRGAPGFSLAVAVVWWGLVVMLVATAYYVIQEAPAARTSAWVRRDFAINLVLLAGLLLALLDGANGFLHLGAAGAGWVAFGAAAIHPLAVDRPHQRHQRHDPAGSPIPRFVPPACLAIDATLAVVVLLATVAL